MIQSNLVIECDNVACTSTVKRGQDDAHIKLTLMDVRIHELMTSLVKEVGVEVILDHISDLQISNYLKAAR
jgi:hypothetical protein